MEESFILLQFRGEAKRRTMSCFECFIQKAGKRFEIAKKNPTENLKCVENSYFGHNRQLLSVKEQKDEQKMDYIGQ